MFAMLGVFSNLPCRGIFEKEDEEVGWRMANIENAGKVSGIGNGTIHFPTFKRERQKTLTNLKTGKSK